MKSILRVSIHYLRVAIGLAAVISILEASRAMADPSCGDTITANVTLSADLNCSNPSNDGLIIGGDHVTLDLNGHAITGPGIVGVRIIGTNATVTNTGTRPGTIKGFECGVYLNPTQGAKVIGLTVTGNGRGIAAGEAYGNTIRANVISGNSQDGIRLGISSHNTISDNTVSKNDFGIAIADGSNFNVVSGNNVSKNRNFGVAIFCGSDSNLILSNSVTNTTGGEAHGIIVRSGSDRTQLMWNAANLNAGDGIHVDIGGGCQDPANDVMPNETIIARNVANRNGNDGIEVAETVSATVQDNTANVNAGYGIFAPDACDGGGNVTKNNLVEQTFFGSSDVTVTSVADSGLGSLREALGSVCVDGTVHFSPALAGQKITLTSGPLTLGKNVHIDGSAAAGLAISGNYADRVLILNAGTTATLSYLTIADGYGWQLAGGVLNNGALTLDHVALTGNTMATDAGDYWQGGGGIYNGSGATLNLIDSSVAGNNAQWSGGGIYSFFNTTTNIIRSTISGNVSSDVGGGIRSLANFTIMDSTISGNTATGWHGGAIFHTDGDIEIKNSTIANNMGPDWAPSTIFIGEWGAVEPSLKLTNTIITGNHWYACEQYASGGTVSLISGGNNVVQDASCNPVASDQIISDAGIGPLGDNGGPTLTHALLPGSPAIDAANDAVCSATDQRGVTRPQGPHCDVGSYEAP